MSSTRTGWNVPAPTCNVTNACRTRRRSSAAKTAASKCRPAVGAATAPGARAIHGLVALAIGGLGRAVDVGRQRHLAVSLEECQHVARELAGGTGRRRRSSMRALWPPGRFTRAPRLQPLAGARMHQRRSRAVSTRSSSISTLSAAVLDAVHARRHHARIVEHQQIRRRAAAPANREIAGPAAIPRAPSSASMPAGGARRDRALGDEFRGQIEVKIRALHAVEQYYQVRQSHILRGSGMPGWRNW